MKVKHNRDDVPGPFNHHPSRQSQPVSHHSTGVLSWSIFPLRCILNPRVFFISTLTTIKGRSYIVFQSHQFKCHILATDCYEQAMRGLNNLVRSCISYVQQSLEIQPIYRKPIFYKKCTHFKFLLNASHFSELPKRGQTHNTNITSDNRDLNVLYNSQKSVQEQP